MPVTIRDVAKRLNLSITTVSRALDGYDDVAEATRERVIRVAREMGYVPSRAARQLRRQRADAIGFVMPVSQPRYSDPFFSELLSGLGDEAGAQALDLVLSMAPPDDEGERTTYRRWVQSRRVDGIVLSRMRLDDWRARYLSDAGFPFVAYGRTRTPDSFPFVGVDGAAGVRALVRHLVDRGHRRLGFVGAPATLTFQADRFAGFRDGLADAGLPLDAELVAEGDLTVQGGYAAARRLLAHQEKPSAVICVNDLTAIGAMRAAHEAGLRVGQDLAVAGFDGTAAAEHATPPLTTLNQPVYDIARRVVRMLVALMQGAELEERQVILMPELVIRASTTGP